MTASATEAPEIAAILRQHAEVRVGVSQVLSALGEVPAGFLMTMLAMATLPACQAGIAALDECLPDALLLSSPGAGTSVGRGHAGAGARAA